jgi:hypothetical protein
VLPRRQRPVSALCVRLALLIWREALLSAVALVSPSSDAALQVLGHTAASVGTGTAVEAAFAAHPGVCSLPAGAAFARPLTSTLRNAMHCLPREVNGVPSVLACCWRIQWHARTHARAACAWTPLQQFDIVGRYWFVWPGALSCAARVRGDCYCMQVNLGGLPAAGCAARRAAASLLQRREAVSRPQQQTLMRTGHTAAYHQHLGVTASCTPLQGTQEACPAVC